MRLPLPFYKLSVRFDVERLQSEVAALRADAWAKHPNEIAGNSSIRLISVNGGENDDVNGIMLPTPHLQRSPYLRQVLASFGVVWSRSRLLRLAPQAGVPEHADINYHWFNRVRVHIPIVTQPAVRFHCGDQSVHMAAGEAWIFDNWRLHRVENPVDQERIHLVADTSGSAAFWQFVAHSSNQNAAQASGQATTQPQQLQYDAQRSVMPLTERTVLAAVMPPAEVELLIMDLRAELVRRSDTADSHARLMRFHGLLESLCHDWRQLYALHGDAPDGWPEFIKLRDSVRAASRVLGEGLALRTNAVAAHLVLEGRVLRAMLSLPAESPPSRATASGKRSPDIREPASPSVLERPIFIVAAPRSGSTLLFETLAASSRLATLGGEAHWLVESIEQLRPGAPGVDSNRLTAEHATAEVAARIKQQISERLQDSEGRAISAHGRRFLEKTPKNALRIPFFRAIFPDARFVFLWRDPRENLGSIMAAWRSGNWKTYDGLDGFTGPWSLLLPPGWRRLDRQPLERIAAYQWNAANTIIMDDLQCLSPDSWSVVNYAELLADPAATVRRLCDFMQIEFDAGLARRLQAPLPHSRYTLTPPAADKWRIDEAAILSVLPDVDATWQRLRAL